MAQVRKLQNGYTINSIPGKQYFLVGDASYDLKNFENLIWYNFDPWIDNKHYNNKVRNEAKRFIVQVLDELKTNDARFNSDLSLEFRDVNDEWDNTPGFNKRGPKFLHWLTDDKIDDNRGIPKIAMNFLQQVLRSPYMEKKPDQVALGDLTRKVIDNVIKIDFGNNYNRFISPDDGFRTFNQKDRVRVFKNALEDFRKTTDFSIYDQSNLKEIDDNMKKAIDLLGNATAYDDNFFDQMSQYGFHGLKNWLGEDPKDEDEEEQDQQLQDSYNDWFNRVRNSRRNGGNNGGSNESSTYDQWFNRVRSSGRNNRIPFRQYGEHDYQRYAKPIIQSALSSYYGQMPYDWQASIDWRNGKVGFQLTKFFNFPILDIRGDLYEENVRKLMSNRHIKSREVARQQGKELTRELVQYLMGRNTPHFTKTMNPKNRVEKVQTILSQAHAENLYTPILSDAYVFIKDSYDPVTKCYLAIDINNNALFALPEIFLKSKIWEQITTNINNAIKASGVAKKKQYSVQDVYKLSLTRFLNDGRTVGNAYGFFQDIRGYKKGGILKALNGDQLKQRILGGNSSSITSSTRSIYSNSPVGKTAQQIRTERENLRRQRQYDREEVSETRDEYYDAQNELKRQDYLDRQDVIITSWKDLKNNLDTHDKFVIGTLLSDLVALGGSLSGGAFNPVTDVATLASTIGVIGTVATDESMNTLEKVGYGALGVGLNVLGMIPGIGAGAKTLQITKNAAKAIKPLSKLIYAGALGITGFNAIGPLTKLAEGKPLTKGEWTDLAYFTEALIMGHISSKSTRDFKRYTKPVEPKTKYYVQTRNGRVQVSKATYDKVNNIKLKSLKSEYSGNRKLKGINGEDIAVSQLKPRGIYGTRAYGEVETTNAGFRLKTLEELHQEYNIPKIEVDGKVSYEVPRGYLSVAQKLGQRPMISIKEGPSETTVVKGDNTVTTTKPKAKEQTTSTTPKQPPKPQENGKKKGTDGNDGTTPTNPNPQPQQKPQKELTPAQVARQEELKQIDEDVKQVVRDFIQNRYKGRTVRTNYTSDRVMNLFKRVQEFKDVTKAKFPSKIEPGFTYFITEKGNVIPVNRKKHTSTFNKYKDKEYRYFSFGKGGNIIKYQNPSSGIVKATNPNPTERHDGDDPERSAFFRNLRLFGKNLFNEPNTYFAAAMLNADALSKKNFELKQKELPFLKTVPTGINIKVPDLYGIQNQGNKAIGANNYLAGRPVTSDIQAHLGNAYEYSLSNEQVADKVNTLISKQIDTNQTEINTALNELNTLQRTISDDNRKAIIADYDKKLTNQQERNLDKHKIISDALNKFYNESVTKKEAKLSLLGEVAKTALDKFSPYIEAIRTKEEERRQLVHKWLYDDNGRPIEGHSATDDDLLKNPQYQAITEELNKLYIESDLYGLVNSWRATQGELDLYDILRLRGLDVDQYPYFIKNYKGINPNGIQQQQQPTQQQPQTNAKGGTLSYEDRMNLKKQDARNKKQEMWYKMIIEDRKQASAEKKQKDKSYDEAKRLINKKSEMLLKASLQIK